MNLNYEKDMEIDESALDIEWLEQPTLLFKYGKEKANIEYKANKQKEKLEYEKAKLDIDIRTNHGKYGLEKVTETGIANVIATHKIYLEEKEMYNELLHDLNLITVALNAINTKKYALENLVKLHGMNYFAGPEVPRELTNIRKNKQEQVNKEANQKVKLNMQTKKLEERVGIDKPRKANRPYSE